uniref:Uncharacterized protein n=1 Tax=Leersia perrieri TaxID=77586 RepID=A0A0D9W557_9ORYZ
MIARLGECVDEGCEGLGYDPSNVKAYYRRGKGNLEAAVGDLRKAHELSPNEETIGEVLKDVEKKLAVKLPRGVVIEEIVEDPLLKPTPPPSRHSSPPAVAASTYLTCFVVFPMPIASSSSFSSIHCTISSSDVCIACRVHSPL